MLESVWKYYILCIRSKWRVDARNICGSLTCHLTKKNETSLRRDSNLTAWWSYVSFWLVKWKVDADITLAVEFRFPRVVRVE